MPPKPRKPITPTPVEATKHRDTRVNIPTAELRDFAETYEASPGKLLYPRDPSLDPQLVWKGKDEQDQKPLEVPVVPVYIQESIQPRAIIENVRAEARRVGAGLAPPSGGGAEGVAAPGAREWAEQLAMNFFGDFNGLTFDERVDFYQHEQDWTNRMILGDSLLVMASLAEKEGLKGKVQMIYMDPPYGIRFGSNWQVSTRKREVKDGKAEDLAREPEVIKAFRDTWELGIHSYLSYLRDRFRTALDLLADTGSMFVQIGDENVHLVRNVLDEVFGSANFVSLITFQKAGSTTAELISNPADYVLWYAKNRDVTKFRRLYLTKEIGGSGASKYTMVELPDGSRVPASQIPDSVDASVCRALRFDAITSQGYRANTSVPFEFRGKTYDTGSNKNWKTTLDGMRRLAVAGRIEPSRGSLNYVRYIDDFPVFELTSVWPDVGGVQSRDDPKIYVVQTSATAIQRCVLMATDPGDLVLDPTCGSGTTAYVAEEWGRRWITVDSSRVALALARTRLMSARYPYYLLADSQEGVQKEAEITGQMPPAYQTTGDIKKGFVYKRVPHVTLKSIANNPDVKEGMTREEIDAAIRRHGDTEVLYDQPYEDKARIRVAGPFTVESLSPHRVLSAGEERPESERAGERADSGGRFEITIIDNLRKAGVQNTKKNERLAFDRLEPFAGAWLHAEGEYTDKAGASRRVAISIGPQYGAVGAEQVKEAAKEALKGAGFDVLVVCGFAFDAHAGETAREFSPDAVGAGLAPPLGGGGAANADRVGAPLGTGGGAGGAAPGGGGAADADRVGATGRSPSGGGGAGAEAGFIAEETKQYGKLPVMLARMNLDLTMGDEVLKKTGTGNLFMVFGEPDVVIERVPGDTSTPGGSGFQPDTTPGAAKPPVGQDPSPDRDKLVVEVRGVDVYDPTTGQIRASSTDDIACWFIDTNYNGESFFVRHAYFCGDDEPYDKLKRALRAEVDEAAWSTLYSTRSYPFDPPETGKIAVKVINHYGDEVLKVYEV